MKSVARIVLIDCGKASRNTKGALSGPFTEAFQAPYTHWG
jgi:hypothetical protein